MRFLTWLALVLQSCNCLIYLSLFESQSLALNPQPFRIISNYTVLLLAQSVSRRHKERQRGEFVSAWEGEPFCPLHTGEFASLYAHHWTAKPTHASGHQFCPWFLLCTLVCVMCPSEPTVTLVLRTTIGKRRIFLDKVFDKAQLLLNGTSKVE